MGTINIISYREKLLVDREQAAEMLKLHLGEYEDRQKVVVLGIPRGGVILSDKLAGYLNAELDIVLTRKIRAPHNPEFAIGAVSEDGKVYLNESMVSLLNVPKEYIEKEKNYQLKKIEQRRELYRQVLEKTPLNGKIVILTDDGAATGATMQAAIWAAIGEFPEKIILALPVAPADTLEKLAKDVDETICLCSPINFRSISQFYGNFEQVTDEQIVEVLKNYAKAKTHE